MISTMAVGIGMGVVVVLVALWAMLSTRKTRWYKVYLANNHVKLMYRTSRERWGVSEKYVKFNDDNGHQITFPSEAHWILFWEQIPDHEVGMVRQQLIAERAKRLEEERQID